MTPQHQTLFGGAPGNCFAACVASVLDVDLADVPNFVDDPTRHYMLRAAEWCRPLGWLPVHIAAAHVTGVFDAIAIAGGMGPRGLRHSVVWRDDVMLFDPHPSGDGLVGDPEAYVVFAALDPGRSK